MVSGTFFEPGQNTLAYLNLTPPQRTLPNGRVITERAIFYAPTSRAFVQRDLYSTFFGASVNDEIERKLYGSIDARGSRAIRAFTTDDVREWHRHFETLFEFIDIQKIRTPKGQREFPLIPAIAGMGEEVCAFVWFECLQGVCDGASKASTVRAAALRT